MQKFYSDAKRYWDGVASTDCGMLGGYEVLSDADVADSRKFLESSVVAADLHFMADGSRIACDCGAGIGRVSREFLRLYFTEIDLVEQTSKFLDRARQDLANVDGIHFNYYPVGLQSFQPQNLRYNVVWCQWVLSHLSDPDLVAFLERCTKALSPNNGMICVKENVCPPSRLFAMDTEDSSKTRSDALFKQIFQKAGLQVVAEATQSNFPTELYAVKMYALIPAKSKC